jgi:predicted DNA-binding ribbon-helix-helix protein
LAQLKEIARTKECTLSKLIADIDAGRLHGNLSSEIRLFVLDYVRSRGRQIQSPGQ